MKIKEELAQPTSTYWDPNKDADFRLGWSNHETWVSKNKPGCDTPFFAYKLEAFHKHLITEFKQTERGKFVERLNLKFNTKLKLCPKGCFSYNDYNYSLSYGSMYNRRLEVEIEMTAIERTMFNLLPAIINEVDTHMPTKVGLNEEGISREENIWEAPYDWDIGQDNINEVRKAHYAKERAQEKQDAINAREDKISQVKSIRKEYKEMVPMGLKSWEFIKDTADEYCVSRQVIRNMINYKTYKNI